jgi:preprotein translocase subunit SecA
MSIYAPEWVVKAFSWIGWEEGQPIAHSRISKGIERAQKKVEERNFEIRKSLLDYDEVMDYQRKIFYSRRRQILAGKNLKKIIEEMIDSAVTKNCQTILNKSYPAKCIIEWAKSSFSVELKPSDIEELEPREIEEIIKQRAKDNAASDISISLGEYLEDYEDKESWDIAGLSKWAMSAFSVSLTAGKVKNMSAEEIEQQLITASAEQIDKKDCSALSDFLKSDFAIRTFADWTKAKFDINLSIDQLRALKVEQVKQAVLEKTSEKYRQREIEYPVEFAMNMVFGPQGANIYGFDALAGWANRKYESNFSAEQISNMKPTELYKQLIGLSTSYNDGQLEKLIEEKAQSLDDNQLLNWTNQRFDTSFTEETIGDKQQRKDRILDAGRQFLRSELGELEKFVLVQVYDSVWKDHLYAMDHLKSEIHFRAWAEKDPKTEYKREGFQLFEEMLSAIEDRVTDIIFRVRLDAGARARSVWSISSTSHDEVRQFAMEERQRAAAQAPQGEEKVKQIILDKPKVGRNDPCPCGSGKKYKKCCGKNA